MAEGSIESLKQAEVDDFTNSHLGLQQLAAKNQCDNMECFTDKLQLQQEYRENSLWILTLLYYYLGALQRRRPPNLQFSRLLMKCSKREWGGCKWSYFLQRGVIFPEGPESDPQTTNTYETDPNATEVVVTEFGEEAGDWPYTFHLALIFRRGNASVVVPLSHTGEKLLERLHLTSLGSVLGFDANSNRPVLAPVHSPYYALLWFHVAHKQPDHCFGRDRVA